MNEKWHFAYVNHMWKFGFTPYNHPHAGLGPDYSLLDPRLLDYSIHAISMLNSQWLINLHLLDILVTHGPAKIKAHSIDSITQ